MASKTLGFIGGGRITRVILGGLKNARKMPDDVVVSDANADALKNLKRAFPEIQIADRNVRPAQQNVVFLALHPPVLNHVLSEIETYLSPDAVVISLAPKITISKISEKLNGFRRIVRMIPNAPSIINSGYNPVAFSTGINKQERNDLLLRLAPLGQCPIVDEEKLEAYAIVSGMGPTYLWFQLYELQKLGKSFGLSDEEIINSIPEMVTGAARTMFKSGLSSDQVLDLIPVKPLAEEEENIKKIYNTKLGALFQKLKS